MEAKGIILQYVHVILTDYFFNLHLAWLVLKICSFVMKCSNRSTTEEFEYELTFQKFTTSIFLLIQTIIIVLSFLSLLLSRLFRTLRIPGVSRTVHEWCLGKFNEPRTFMKSCTDGGTFKPTKVLNDLWITLWKKPDPSWINRHTSPPHLKQIFNRFRSIKQ